MHTDENETILMKHNKIIVGLSATVLAVFFMALLNNSVEAVAVKSHVSEPAKTMAAMQQSVVSLEANEIKPIETPAVATQPAVTIKPAPVVPAEPVVTQPAPTPNSNPKPALAAKYSYELKIPAINITAPVLGMGLTPDGKQMDVPANFTEVGWYNLGTKPGDIGNAVLGAHVDNGGSTPGVFKNLKNLKVGNDIYMTDKDGKVLHYRIAQTKIYPYNAKDTSEVFGSNGKSRLVLITCHGTFMPSLDTYDQRFIVFAELVN